MKFEVGDVLVYANGDSDGKFFIVKEVDTINKSYILRIEHRDRVQVVPDMVGNIIDRNLKLHYRKVKATNLAKKLYPQAEEKEGYLWVK